MALPTASEVPMLDHAQASYRAEQARRLLTDPLFAEARETVETQLKELIVSLPLAARDEREQAVAILKGAEQFFRIFALILNDYQISNAEMLQEEQLKARSIAIQERLNHV
jgi:hypothetical protein